MSLAEALVFPSEYEGFGAPVLEAMALGTPCVGLYGPTSAERNGPYGQIHRTLAAPHGVMAALGVEPVLRSISEILAR